MSSDTSRSAAALAAVVLLATGCGITPDEDSPTVAYREAQSVRSLEVPPDLVKPASDQALALPRAGGDGALLPEFDGVRYVRAGASTWLEFEGVAPDTVWPRVQGFVRAQGLTVERADPGLGIVETDWAERYDGPASGGLFGLLGGLFGGGPDTIRDRYRIRLERMDDGAGTRVFVTHRAAQEVARNQGNRRDPASYTWARRDGDPSIEAEMTRRLLVHLGVSEQRAQGIVADAAATDLAVRYVETEAGVARVTIAGNDYRRVFVRVGDALDRVGAEIEVAERERGRYRLRWTPPAEVAEETTGGFLGLFGGGEPTVQTMEVHLRLRDGSVRAFATDAEGTRRSGPVQKALLRRLAEAMGGEAVIEGGGDEDGGTAAGASR